MARQDVNAVSAPKVYRHAYRPCAFAVEHIDLDFTLSLQKTVVKAEMLIQRLDQDVSTLVLYGVNLTLIHIAIDGHPLSSNTYEVTSDALHINLDYLDTHAYRCQIITEIYPHQNKALSGLYQSGNHLCTQCEAQGFRRIMYALDRPDVLATYRVRLFANKTDFPILLCNGNLIDKGHDENGNHWVLWDDPHPKPTYLFAIVAGQFDCVNSQIATKSGSLVDVRVYVDRGHEHKAKFPLQAAIKAIRWDEEHYDRCYDLEVFNIVAINDFNAGAMENKGLNIFNANCILAHHHTSTDADMLRVENVVAHEYFHNWSGNRVTLRDWFELSLKEGLTVYRDQCFSADTYDPLIQRIRDANIMINSQFVEDAGPMSHCVRPEMYTSIDNFYTLTVYEKGARIIGMLATIMTPCRFKQAIIEYFERFDGRAVTIDDMLAVVAEYTDINIEQYKLWFQQAGTPRVTLTSSFDPKLRRVTLTCQQQGANKGDRPYIIPMQIAMLDASGQAMQSTYSKHHAHEHTVLIDDESKTFIFDHVDRQPILSCFRDFSAPIIMEQTPPIEELKVLARHDTDPFNAWQASRMILDHDFKAFIGHDDKPMSIATGHWVTLVSDLLSALLQSDASIIDQKAAYICEFIRLPTFGYLLGKADHKVDDVFAFIDAITLELSKRNHDMIRSYYDHIMPSGCYQFTNAQIGRRALAGSCLALLMTIDQPLAISICQHQYSQSDNMTDTINALAAMNRCDDASAMIAMQTDFYERYAHDPLVVDRWLRLKASKDHVGVYESIEQLIDHQSFRLDNPNSVRALIGGFMTLNPRRFHDSHARGYALVANVLMQIDRINPYVCANCLKSFQVIGQLDTKRKHAMRATIHELMKHLTSSMSQEILGMLNI